MGRKRIQIEKIDNERTRQVTFYKRKRGLLKKAMEIALLCQVKVMLCIVDHNEKCILYSSEEPDTMIEKYIVKKLESKSYLKNHDYRNYSKNQPSEIKECIQETSCKVSAIPSSEVQPSVTASIPGNQQKKKSIFVTHQVKQSRDHNNAPPCTNSVQPSADLLHSKVKSEPSEKVKASPEPSKGNDLIFEPPMRAQKEFECSSFIRSTFEEPNRDILNKQINQVVDSSFLKQSDVNFNEYQGMLMEFFQCAHHTPGLSSCPSISTTISTPQIFPQLSQMNINSPSFDPHYKLNQYAENQIKMIPSYSSLQTFVMPMQSDCNLQTTVRPCNENELPFPAFNDLQAFSSSLVQNSLINEWMCMKKK